MRLFVFGPRPGSSITPQHRRTKPERSTRQILSGRGVKEQKDQLLVVWTHPGVDKRPHHGGSVQLVDVIGEAVSLQTEEII